MASEMLDLQRFFIKEQVAMLRTVDVYDIFNPDTQEQIGQAREEISTFKQIARWFINKQLMSTTVEVTDTDGELVFTIHRPFSFWRAHVDVLDHNGRRLGYFKSKLFTIGGGFWVYNDNDKQFAEVKGDWKGWNFKFLTPGGAELGEVTKKWAGLGKELFTSADNYIVSIDDELADQPVAKCLLLAAALAIDIVYKEQAG